MKEEAEVEAPEPEAETEEPAPEKDETPQTTFLDALADMDDLMKGMSNDEEGEEESETED